jgi:hypothetical protein
MRLSVAHTFPSFQRLLDKVLAIEHTRVQLGDIKRKVISQGQGSSSVRPRYVPPQGTPVRTGGGQRPAQYTPQGTLPPAARAHAQRAVPMGSRIGRTPPPPRPFPFPRKWSTIAVLAPFLSPTTSPHSLRGNDRRH